MSELSPYEQWQLEKYGNLLPEPTIQSGTVDDDAFRWSEWCNLQFERQLLEYE